MKMLNIIIASVVAMIPFGLIGLSIEGMPGLKLALGIVVMFGLTAGVFVYAMKGLEERY